MDVDDDAYLADLNPDERADEDLTPPARPTTRRRYVVLRLIVVLAFVILAGQLWFLQVVNGDYYRAEADRNSIRLQPITPTRGVIYDRNHRVLVQNEPTWNVAVVAADIPSGQLNALLNQVAAIVHQPAASLVSAYHAQEVASGPYLPRVLAKNISYTMMLTIEQEHLTLPGVQIQVQPYRYYPTGELMGNILGFVGPVSQQEYAQLDQSQYSYNDVMGQAGLEARYETKLRGRMGEDEVIVDAGGRPIRTLATQPAVNGDSLVLSIDTQLQAQVQAILIKWLKRVTMWPTGQPPMGMVAIEDVHTGQILSMVSYPGYDDNLFARGITKNAYETLLNDPAQPLLNKAISATYPPGSTFKIVTASAALQLGVITPYTTVVDDGLYCIDGDCANGQYHGWQGIGVSLGAEDVVRALADSSDIFFYTVGAGHNPNAPEIAGVGNTHLAAWSELYGLGQPTGIDLPDEAPGTIPDQKWIDANLQGAWYTGNTVQMAIGQSFITVTPLQMLNIAAAVANGGTLYQPQVVQQIIGPSGNVVRPFTPHVIRHIPISAQNLALVQEGMRMCVTKPGASGYNVRLLDLAVAGKTGTAQYGVVRNFGGHLPSDAWFVSYAPFNNPQIAVVVSIPGGFEGAYLAVPIARDVYKAYFHIKGIPDPSTAWYYGDTVSPN